MDKEINDLIKNFKNIIKDSGINTDDIYNEYFKNFNESNIETKKNKIITYINYINALIRESKGKVRTFIRLKGLSKKDYNVNIIDDKISILCENDKIPSIYGPFKKIYDNEITNIALFKDPEMVEIIKLLMNGVSTLLFSYGLSGSGKTYTLFGNKDSIGIVQYIISQLVINGFKIKVISIKEEYINEFVIDINNINNLKTISGKIINNNEEIDKNINNEKDIDELIETINYKRKNVKLSENKRIKSTPNNKESSRSHLYITFEVKKDKNISYFTIIDCAGRETPKEIFDSYFNFERTTNTPGYFLFDESTDYSKLLNNKSENIPNIKKIIKEGYYINESLNHLIFFINKQIDKDYTINNKQIQKNISNQYKPEKYFENPSRYYDSSVKSLLNTNIQTIPILNDIYSKTGSSGLNPKIIMFCNVRLDNNKCNDTKKTLDFAQQIKST
jgi:hypothetical protein